MQYVFILLVSSFAFAGLKPVCDESAVTKNCEVFAGKQDQVSFKLSDGTSLKGPNANKTSPPVVGIQSQDYLNQFSLEDEVLEILDTVDMPTATRMDVSKNLREFSPIQKGRFHFTGHQKTKGRRRAILKHQRSSQL